MLSIIGTHRRYIATAAVILVLIIPLALSRFSGPVHHKPIPWPASTANRDDAGPPVEMLGKDGPIFKEHEGTLWEVLNKINMADALGKAAPILELDPNVHAKAVPEFGDWINSIKITTDDGREFLFRGCPDLPMYLKSYMRGDYQEAPRRLTHKDAIPAERAKEKALALVEALGLDFDLSGSRPSLVDFSGGDDDLDGAYWSIGTFRRYQGYETNSTVNVSVSAYAEEVVDLRILPLVVPKSMEVRIGPGRAREIVQSFTKDRSLNIEEPQKAELAIVQPNSAWVADGEPRRKSDIVHPRLAYRVQARINRKDPQSKGFSCEFWVDAATGGIVGGYQVPDMNPCCLPTASTPN